MVTPDLRDEQAERQRAVARTIAGVLVGVGVSVVVVAGALLAILMLAFATMDV